MGKLYLVKGYLDRYFHELSEFYGKTYFNTTVDNGGASKR